MDSRMQLLLVCARLHDDIAAAAAARQARAVQCESAEPRRRRFTRGARATTVRPVVRAH